MGEFERAELSPLEQAINRYETALTNVEIADTATEADVIDLLLARDGVDTQKQSATALTVATSVKLLALDKRLRQQAAAIHHAVSLDQCQASLTPSSSAWWWSLEPPPPPTPTLTHVNKLDNFDWVWNLLTVTCLVFSASFATNTAKAFSTQGFDLAGTISTISQGAGVALIAGGALTDKGRKVTENVLKSLGIPAAFYAEATFGFSATLLGATFLLNNSLDQVGATYERHGHHLLAQGDLVTARDKYVRAMDFMDNDKELFVALGHVSSDLGELDKAEEYYRQGMALGEAAAMDGLARTLIIKQMESQGWNVKIDDLVARQAEFYLDWAYTRATKQLSDDELLNQLQRFAAADASALSRQDRATLLALQSTAELIRSIYSNWGLLKLAQIDFAEINPDVADALLIEAESYFTGASEFESSLQTLTDKQLLGETNVLELGKADC